MTGGFFLGSGGADSKEKGPGPAGPAECFSENTISGKTIFIYFAPQARNSAEGLFAALAP
jgi:hypothetical protein